MSANNSKPQIFWLAREFESWLKSNRHRFAREPYLLKANTESAIYRFHDVTNKIELYLDHGGQFLISVNNFGQCVDLICELDVCVEQTKSGKYFCSICVPKYRRYYMSRKALLVSHCFKPLIEWVASQLKPENLLVISGGGPAYWTAAAIMSARAAKKKIKDVRFRYPVIVKER